MNKNINKNINKLKKYIFYIVNLLIIIFIFLYYRTYDFLKYASTDIYLYLLMLFPLCIAFIIYTFLKFNFIISFFIGFLIQWIILLNVNPVELHFDNKLALIKNMPTKYNIQQQDLLSNININKIKYPIVIKPIICSGNGENITIIYNKLELIDYLKKIKISDRKDFMIQTYLFFPIELEILYEKMPWEKQGKIIEIIEKTNNHELIRIFEFNYTINHSKKINKKINKLFNNLSKRIPNLNVARYSIRLKKFEDLYEEKFKIIEIGGTMGLSLQVGILFDLKWFFTRILIGLYNIISFNGYSLINLIKVLFISYYRAVVKCNEWSHLYSLYS